MRNEYYNLIKYYGIQDTLFLIENLSYSQKHKIVSNLLKKYNSHTINRALCCYEFEYIKSERVRTMLIENTLKNICNRIVEGDKANAKLYTV